MPVPPGAGPDEFLSLVEQLVVPLARRFAPDLLAISAGYDAHRADPLASCRLDEATYADMTAAIRASPTSSTLRSSSASRAVIDPAALAASVVATIEALESDREARTAPAAPSAPYLERVREHWADL